LDEEEDFDVDDDFDEEEDFDVDDDFDENNYLNKEFERF